MKSIKFFSGLIRPCALIFGVLLASSAMVLMSCSDDDDDKDGGQDEGGITGEITLETPEYEDVSAKYEITSGAAGISSIELTASGNYIVVYENAVPSYIAAKKSTRTSFIGMVTGARHTTRATSNGYYGMGTFIKISDTEFILDGFGTVVIEGASDNSFSIQLTGQDGQTYTLGANIVETMPNSVMTNAICRTWDINTVRMRAKYNGNVVFNEEKDAADYPQLIKDLNKAFASLVPDDEDGEEEDFFDVPNYGYSQFIFTKSGTYMFTTTTSELGFSYWKWQDESNGILRYTHDASGSFDTYLANDVTISLSGKSLSMAEVNMNDSEDDGDESYSLVIESFYSCTEAQ